MYKTLLARKAFTSIMSCLADLIKPIALPPRSYKNQNFDGKSARVSGWGKTSDSKFGYKCFWI